MNNTGIALLGYALLGLLHQKAASGYDLRKIFAETPMGNFSDSPGAIYPALRRLEEKKLVHSAILRSAGLRQRKVLRITLAGLTELQVWLTAPITRMDVVRRMNEVMLRFAFLDGVMGEATTLQFLRSLEAELSTYIPTLKKYLKSNVATMPISGGLALESGILSYEAQLRWASHAITIYKRKAKSQ